MTILGLEELILLHLVKSIDKRHPEHYSDPAPWTRIPVLILETSTLGDFLEDPLQNVLNRRKCFL